MSPTWCQNRITQRNPTQPPTPTHITIMHEFLPSACIIVGLLAGSGYMLGTIDKLTADRPRRMAMDPWNEHLFERDQALLKKKWFGMCACA
jgi:NADH-ubiquinone oxidoreductase MWFE subunit